jgi:transcriptional regulator with XRE-family HTH domain
MKKNKQSLFKKMMKNDDFKQEYDVEKQIFEIEYQLAKIMEENGISQKVLAERLGIDKSVVSKDLSGALSKAGVQKLQAIAEAIGCEFIPLFIPKNKKSEFEEHYNEMLLDEVKEA